MKCAGFDALQYNIIRQIGNGHWGIVWVGIGTTADNPAFAYTVGLHSQGKPEFIFVAPFSPQTVSVMLNISGGILIEENLDKHPVGVINNDIASLPSTYIDVDPKNVKDKMYHMYEYYKTWDIPVQQLVWSDKQGKFPWDSTSEFMPGGEFENTQTILGTAPKNLMI